MQNTTQNIWMGVDPAKPGSDRSVTMMSVESMELILNEARMDERKIRPRWFHFVWMRLLIKF